MAVHRIRVLEVEEEQDHEFPLWLGKGVEVISGALVYFQRNGTYRVKPMVKDIIVVSDEEVLGIAPRRDVAS